MEKKLNILALASAMDAKGLSQAKLAKAMNVTPTSVSQWLREAKMPRPDKLLKLGMLLQLPFNQLVIRPSDPMAPVVAFRKRSPCKKNEECTAAAKRRGTLLKQLAPYLPFDPLVTPSVLKQPSADYAYLQEVVLRIRNQMGVRPDEKLAIRHLIKLFSDLHTVLIPVIWGAKGHYADGLHIYLPDSQTRWVYVNLDSYLWDFAFWMAHELGHCLAPNMEEAAGDVFADAFAQTLLFPEVMAKAACDELNLLPSAQARISRVLEMGKEHNISPVTVACATACYAKANQLPPPVDPQDHFLHAAVSTAKKQEPTVAQVCIGYDVTPIPPQTYIRSAKETFGSPFFETLKVFLLKQPQKASFIQELLDIPLLDAKAIYEELR